jgi:hypothetical protein
MIHVKRWDTLAVARTAIEEKPHVLGMLVPGIPGELVLDRGLGAP